jgi:Putative beta barrel porin-7 (BBP7)
VPPLVTAGPAGSTGALGSPGTTVIFGGSDLNHEEFSGGRFAAGMWLDDCQTVGVEADFFFLAPRSTNFFVGGGTGGPVIARPFINALTGEETSEFVSSPLVSGNVQVHSRSELFGGGVNGICNLCCCCTHRVDLLAGFRYLQLEEKLDITENLTLAPTVPTFGGSQITVRDHFETQNRFYGGQLGVRGEWWRGRAFVNARGLVALGDTHESIDIHGVTTLTPPGGTTTTVPGGILALPSNSGHFHRDEFSVVPEVGINVGYQVTDHLRAYVGYTFLYWSDVVRPGDQIDRTINLSQVPSTGGSGVLVGPARPAVLFKNTDFWAQGINVGLEFRF